MGFFEKSPKTIITEYLDQCVLKREDDWELILSACDAVNSSDNGAKEAAKFIKKKISKQQPPIVQDRVLTILRAMADNCGARFHAEIASRKFLDELEAVVISSQTEPSIKQKLVELLGDLSKAFQNEPSLWPISSLYSRLTGESIPRLRQSTMTSDFQRSPASMRPVTNAKPSIERMMDDVELAKNNTQLFTQMISFTDPEREDITTNDLIQEFYEKCKESDRVIVRYISEMQDEQWLSTLISTNQEIVNAFKMYDEMVERGQVTMAKKKSKSAVLGIDYDHEDPENCAGVGGSGTSQLDPFSDLNELKSDSTVPRKSERSRGKMPASIYYDESIFQEDGSDSNNRSQYPPNLTERSQPNSNHNNINGRQEHAII